MPGLLHDPDSDGLLEYSVVYTDRALNHMSASFQSVMNDISSSLKSVYHADAVAVIPGSGSFGMEAVARQFAPDQHTLIVRNGWFSFRWTQILDAADIARSSTVMKARPAREGRKAPFVPAPIAEVVAAIRKERPGVVFAPHVETSSGILLPTDYLKALSDAVHEGGGMLVLDCIASGTIWVDMKACGVDVLISAPQKGWSAPACSALVMMSELAENRLGKTRSSSFACDLAKWREIMVAYENGGHAYHATMPTDALRAFRDTVKETEAYGLEAVREEQQELGNRVRALLTERGFTSVAADGFDAPGVVVVYTDDPDLRSGAKFAAAGLQIAAGVPLQCDEPDDFSTFRLGLFGLDKLHHVDRTVASLERALDHVVGRE